MCIGDFVWDDQNFDDIQDASESSIENVTVKLRKGTDNSIITTTTTDFWGYYKFTGRALESYDLTPGDYYVEFVKPAEYNYISPKDRVDDIFDSDPDTSTGQTAVTTLAANETDLTWDCVSHRSLSFLYLSCSPLDC